MDVFFQSQMGPNQTLPEEIRRRRKEFEDKVVYPKCSREFYLYGGGRRTSATDGHAQRILARLDELKKDGLNVTPLNPEKRLGEEEAKWIWRKPSRLDKLKNFFNSKRKDRHEFLKDKARANSEYLIKPNSQRYPRPNVRTSNLQSEFAINVDPPSMDEFLRRLPKLFEKHGRSIESITVHPPAGQHLRTSSVTISFAGRDHQQQTCHEISQYLSQHFNHSTWGNTPPGGLRVGMGEYAVGSYTEMNRPSGQTYWTQKQTRSDEIAKAITNCLADHDGNYELAREHLGDELRKIVKSHNYRPDSVGLLKNS